ncbi:MAG: hypothetical protein A3G25_13930 [Betaproteobacteria bacterium RIFCSPLOWO2_12_FULL_63_13]|nr:MAG: hypothetical protein A3G25_13930 [Betaproteobacteria bacterium RIFCSPLOWO2_12_FULL_63_13]
MTESTLLSRFYVASDDLLRKIMIGAEAIYEGLWLGLLDNRHLDEAGRLKYASWKKFSEDAYNLSGLECWEESALTRHYKKESAVLLAAAGGGREAVALARLGFNVYAFESTPGLAKACSDLIERLQLQVRVETAAPGCAPESLSSYEGIIIGWGAYMHIPGRSNRVRFLQSLRTHVEPGAPLLMSFLCRNDRTRRHTWIFNIAQLIRRTRRCQDAVDYGDALCETFDHHFTEHEIRDELSEGGFSLREYHKTPYGNAVAYAT